MAAIDLFPVLALPVLSLDPCVPALYLLVTPADGFGVGKGLDAIWTRSGPHPRARHRDLEE